MYNWYDWLYRHRKRRGVGGIAVLRRSMGIDPITNEQAFAYAVFFALSQAGAFQVGVLMMMGET